jgi:hypothetical protein
MVVEDQSPEGGAEDDEDGNAEDEAEHGSDSG